MPYLSRCWLLSLLLGSTLCLAGGEHDRPTRNLFDDAPETIFSPAMRYLFGPRPGPQTEPAARSLKVELFRQKIKTCQEPLKSCYAKCAQIGSDAVDWILHQECKKDPKTFSVCAEKWIGKGEKAIDTCYTDACEFPCNNCVDAASGVKPKTPNKYPVCGSQDFDRLLVWEFFSFTKPVNHRYWSREIRRAELVLSTTPTGKALENFRKLKDISMQFALTPFLEEVYGKEAVAENPTENR